jgi:hypothetical protein
MVTPRNNRILLGCAGTGDHQENYRNYGAENLIQYSDISFIHVHNLNNAKLFYTAVKTLPLQNISTLDGPTRQITKNRRRP